MDPCELQSYIAMTDISFFLVEMLVISMFYCAFECLLTNKIHHARTESDLISN